MPAENKREKVKEEILYSLQPLFIYILSRSFLNLPICVFLGLDLGL